MGIVILMYSVARMPGSAARCSIAAKCVLSFAT